MIAHLIYWLKARLHRCAEDGCWRKGNPCFFPPEFEGDEGPHEWRCVEHAQAGGFCYCCGAFCAGIESFDFGPHRGLCENCADEIHGDEPDHRSDDDDRADEEYDAWVEAQDEMREEGP